MVNQTTEADLVRRLHQAQNDLYGGGSDSSVRALLTSDIAWHVPGDNAIAGHYRGIDDVLRYFRRRRDLADATFTMKVQEILDGRGDRVAALTDGSATIQGRSHSWTTVGLYRLREGRIAECWLLPLDAAQFDAVWAPPMDAPQHFPSVAPSSVVHVLVRPRHCDAQGVVHASRYYEYFEDALLQWLDDHAGGHAAIRATGADLVVAASACEHRRGATLDEQLAIDVRPVAAGRSSLEVEFAVSNDTGTALATGRTTYVAVSVAAGAVALPEPLRELTRGLPPPRRRHS